MELDYNRYLFISDLLRKLSTSFHIEDYKTKNLIEQLILEHYNRGKTLEEMPDLSVEYKKMKERGYGIDPDKARDIIIFMFKRYIYNFKNSKLKRNIQPIFTENTFIYDKFTKVISAERLKLLRSYGDKACAHMLLRYGSIISSSQHWAIPLSEYKKIDFDIEGFASPINSQALILGKKFCSLFYDTDKPFGSLGSFFEQDFTGKKVVINPPFILEIIEKTADYIKKFKKATFYFVAPAHMLEPQLSKFKKAKIKKEEFKNYQFETGEGLVPLNTVILWAVIENS